MRIQRTGAALLVALVGLVGGGCGDDGRAEDLGDCPLACESEADCFYGQKCLDGCCDRIQDRAALEGMIDSQIADGEDAALAGGGECTVAGKWDREGTALFFLHGAGAYLDVDEVLGDVVAFACTSTPSIGDEYLFLTLVREDLYQAGATIRLDGEQGRSEYWHRKYAFTDDGTVTHLLDKILVGTSFDQPDNRSELIVDPTTAGRNVGEEFRVTLSVHIATP